MAVAITSFASAAEAVRYASREAPMTAVPAYISSTIPYVNARPHVGFALELVQADVPARHFRRLDGILALLLGCRLLAEELERFIPDLAVRVRAASGRGWRRAATAAAAVPAPSGRRRDRVTAPG
jgi:hypothetical protein